MYIKYNVEEYFLFLKRNSYKKKIVSKKTLNGIKK